MVKQSLPAVSTVNEANIEEFKTMDKIVIIAFIAPDDKANNDTFTKFAESQRDTYLFAASNDPAVAEAENVKQPSIVLYKDFDEKKAVYDGKWNEDAFHSWAKTASTPLVGEVGPETYSSYITVCTHPAAAVPQSEDSSLTLPEGWYPFGIHFRGNPRGA